MTVYVPLMLKIFKQGPYPWRRWTGCAHGKCRYAVRVCGAKRIRSVPILSANSLILCISTLDDNMQDYNKLHVDVETFKGHEKQTYDKPSVFFFVKS